MVGKMLFLYLASLVMCFLALQGCNESNQLTAWAISGQYTDLIARAGVENDGTEIGGVVKYGIRDDIEWGPEPEIAGAYVIFHLTQDVTVSDTLDPSPLKPWLEALHSRPYAGVEVVGNTDSRVRNFQPNWIAGTSFLLDPDANFALVIEYVDGDQASGDTFIGMRGRF